MRVESKALEWLETGLRERDPNLTWITFDKEFEFLESNPRFQDLLREVGLAPKTDETARRPVIKAKSRRAAFALAALAIVTILGLGYLWKRRAPAPTNEASVTRLTSAPLNEFSPHWTNDGRIRHPSFQGLRRDKPARAVTRERAAAVAAVPRRFRDLKR